MSRETGASKADAGMTEEQFLGVILDIDTRAQASLLRALLLLPCALVHMESLDAARC